MASKPEVADLHLIANSFTAPLMYFVMQSRWAQRDLYSIALVNPAMLTDATLESFATEHLANALRWQRLRRFLAWQLDPASDRLPMEVVPAMHQFRKPVLMVW